MFSGIVEQIGRIERMDNEGSNITFGIHSEISNELKIDQSVAHNGVCLTVVKIEDSIYYVTAVEETLEKSNLNDLALGDEINLERCITMNTRLDGHMVQGHIDGTIKCVQKDIKDGSWLFGFEYNEADDSLLVDKGSVSINGVSLTVIEAKNNIFQVAIIPYTYEHTTFKSMEVGDRANVEFDVIGKYVSKHLQSLKLS